MNHKAIAKAYSKPQQGGELPYFVGKQYGSGWFQNVGRLAFPILKRITRALGNTAEDVIVNNKGIGESLKSNAMNEIGDIFSRKRAAPTPLAGAQIRGLKKKKKKRRKL